MKIDFYRHSLTPEDATAVAKVLGTPFSPPAKSARSSKRSSANIFRFPMPFW